MENFQYNTRSITKATALFTALVNAGYQTNMLSCFGHVHITTAANADQFAIIRASINIPSSAVNDDAALADVVIPDDISSLDS